MMTGEFRWRCWVRVLLPVLLIVYHCAETRGQAPGPAGAARAAAPPAAPAAAPGGGPGATYFRLTFLGLDQWSYVVHPYRQITGDPDFDNSRAASSELISLRPAATDSQSDALTKILHGLPPFGLEWGSATDIFLPKAYSVGVDYFHFAQHDTSAALHGTVPPIATDTYLYTLALRLFAFDPGKPGLNYFVGVGLGVLDGVMKARPYAGQDAQFIKFAQNPFGTTRLGLEAKGDNLGFRYELLLVNADRVHLDKNPYPGATEKMINFSGAIIRLALFYHFG
jgi:hypothetical protein